MTLKKDSLLIFGFGLILFTIGLSPEFVGFQTRFALFARYMFEHGPTFFPTMYSGPYPDYPATSTFIIYLISLLYGEVSPLTAILPNAVISALILVVTYRIGAIRGRRWGWAAVLLTTLTYLFISEARTISIDQYTALVTALCFYVAYSADAYNRRKRLWTIPLILIGGFAFRGPIGLVIPSGVWCGYYLWDRKFKACLLAGLLALILFILCTVGLLGAAYLEGGATLVKKVINMQAAGRMEDRGKGFGFYWAGGFASCALSYPLALIVIASCWRRIIKRENEDYKFLGYLVSWVLIVLVGMSIPGAKKMRYILPMVPGLALVAGYMLAEAAAYQGALLATTKKIFLKVCDLLPLLLCGVAVALFIANKFIKTPLGAYYPGAIGLMVLLSIIGWRLKRHSKNQSVRDLALIAIGAVAFNAFNILIVESIYYGRETTKPFVKKVESLQKRQEGEIVFYRIGPDAEDIKFLVNMERLVRPAFIKQPEEIASFPRRAYFIARENNFAQLPPEVLGRIRLLLRGKIGHRECVVFTLHKWEMAEGSNFVSDHS